VRTIVKSLLFPIKVTWAVMASTAIAALAACQPGVAEEPQAPVPAATVVSAGAPSAPGLLAAPAAPVAAVAAEAPAQPRSPEAPAATNAPTQPAAPRQGTAPALPLALPQYTAKTLKPGEYPVFSKEYSPRPTVYRESPRSADLVRQAKLPPLDQRMPIVADRYIYAPVDEIGVYGGVARITSSSNFTNIGSDLTGGGYCVVWDANGIDWYPSVCKSFSGSPDGKVYTIKIRQGLKWSDGQPFTMKDVEWAWSDQINYNAELNPTVPVKMQDPITGKPVKFTKIDDFTFTLSFENANFGYVESGYLRGGQYCGTISQCMWEPYHYSKNFHPKTPDPAAFEKLMKDRGYTVWTQAWRGKYDVNTTANVPSLGYFYICEGSAQQVKLCANPYFYGADPQGNQLPYLDGYVYDRVEARDVAVFRALSGETDGPFSENFLLQELPLYLANMDKGDFSIARWPDLSGNDAGLQQNLEWNEDPYIGQLIRTQDFRTAISISLDRNLMNEFAYLGIGTAQGWVPHPTAPYYPGAEWQPRNAVRNVSQAKQLLGAMGLVDTDGNGIVNRPDNGADLALNMEANAAFTPIMEVMRSNLADVGIRFTYREGPNSAFNTGAAYYRLRAMPGAENPWYSAFFLPVTGTGGLENNLARYFATNGAQGQAPTGADPKFNPPAPAGNYPADPQGFLMQMQKLFKEGLNYSTLDPKRVEVGKELFRLNLTYLHALGTVGFTGNAQGLVVKRNNLRNVPGVHRSSSFGWHNMTLYFEDGVDNVNHPGNRSKKYTSVSFLTCASLASDRC